MYRIAPVVLLSLVVAARAADTEPPPPLKPETVKKWGGAQTLVIARLTEAQSRGASLSLPPIHRSLLSLKVNEPLRGALKKGEAVKAAHSVRQMNAPTFPVGKDCIVSLVKSRGMWVAQTVEPLSDAELKQVKVAMALPLGWTVDGKKLRSPWAGLGKKWAGPAVKGAPKCEFTGRPALLVGPGLVYAVEAVPPRVAVKFANPDGDGEYKITLKNPTDKPITVPALLTDGKDVLWKECLVILCQGKVYPTPGAKGLAGGKPVTLKPGESISTVINALALKGPEWPRGGYRIEFQIALGEQSEVMSFYYLSRHHDPIRDKAGGK